MYYTLKKPPGEYKQVEGLHVNLTVQEYKRLAENLKMYYKKVIGEDEFDSYEDEDMINY